MAWVSLCTDGNLSCCLRQSPQSDTYVLQGDGGWDLLAALDFVRGQADQSQEQHSLTAVDFLEGRVRKVSMRVVCDTQ